MDKAQENFLKELLVDFKIEASEHYEAIVNGLMMLEKSKDSSTHKNIIELIFREVHSLKGASRAVNLPDIEKLCMSLENIFNNLKKGTSVVFPLMFESFYKATDLLNLLLADVTNDKKNSGKYNLAQIIKNLEFVQQNSLKSKEVKGYNDGFDVSLIPTETKNEEIFHTFSEGQNEELTSEIEESTKSQQIDTQTVRISTQKLNTLLQQSEELVSLKSTFEYYTKELQNISSQYAVRNRKNNEKTVFSDQNITDQALDEYLVAEKDFRKKHEYELYRINKEMVHFQHVANRMIDELLHDVKTTLLFPFSSMLSIFPKIVRDLSKESQKNIECVIIGDRIEIDRRILEEIKDPLIHLIRNCIDHGIENEKERKAKGKKRTGKIEIKIIQDIDRKIELHVTDDGAGLNKNKIIASALKLGIIKTNDVEKLTDNEIHGLIFSSGISSSPFITDISGRGLGMAIVAEKVTKLGGSIELKTTKDVGTNFIISLPQTLSTFRGVLVKMGDQHFILPSLSVEKAIRIDPLLIKTVESRKTISYNKETIALASLADVLRISGAAKKKNSSEFLHIVILNISQRKIALVVDEILGEQEGIVKDLGLQLVHVKNIAGATILGSGKVVPILHPNELMDSASQTNTSLDFAPESSSKTAIEEQKRILVAEDSITIRTLLRNFIENAGYLVKTAVDGQEAYNFLQNEEFDLVVSDIEMPRMNGFELTAKIREDRKHADLPIILVTALETADDKQRGMEAGANGYIVKSSFEKSNLIDAIQRLL